MKGMWKKLFFTKRKEKKGTTLTEVADKNEKPQVLTVEEVENQPEQDQSVQPQQARAPQLKAVPKLPPVELCRAEVIGMDEEPTDLISAIQACRAPSETGEANTAIKQSDEEEGLSFDIASTTTDEMELQLESLTRSSFLEKHGMHEYVKRKPAQKSCCNIIDCDVGKVEDIVLDTVESENEQEKSGEEEMGDNMKEPSEKDDTSSEEESPPRIEETSDIRLVDK